jgi:hypothetical protein
VFSCFVNEMYSVEILTVTNVKMADLWDVTPRSLVYTA